MLCADPIALLLVGGLSLIRFISLVVVSVQSKEGMRMKTKLFISSLLETVWAMVVSATAGTVLSL